jgi:hypothetical protein
VRQALEPREVLDWIRADVNDAEVCVVFEASNRGEQVVADVEFLEGDEGFEA